MNGCEIPLRIKYTEAFEQDIFNECVMVPAVSLSGGIERFRKELIFLIEYSCIFFKFCRAELRFGGKHGDLHYKPPEGYSPIYLYNDGKVIIINSHMMFVIFYMSTGYSVASVS